MVLVLLRVPALAPRWARSQAFSFSLDSQHLLATHVLNFQSNSIIPKQLYSMFISYDVVWFFHPQVISNTCCTWNQVNQKSTIRKPTKSGTNSKNLALALSSGPFTIQSSSSSTNTNTSTHHQAPGSFRGKFQDHSKHHKPLTTLAIAAWHQAVCWHRDAPSWDLKIWALAIWDDGSTVAFPFKGHLLELHHQQKQSVTPKWLSSNPHQAWLC